MPNSSTFVEDPIQLHEFDRKMEAPNQGNPIYIDPNYGEHEFIDCEVRRPHRNKAKIIARIVFPPILLWDGLSLITNRLIRKSAEKRILPLAKHSRGEVALNDEPGEGFPLLSKYGHPRQRQAIPNLPYKRITVTTHDQCHLDTALFESAENKTSGIIIVNFNGTGNTYDDMVEELQALANRIEGRVIGFDYRDINRSTGKFKRTKDLVTDGIAQVQRLLDVGCEPNNIVLKGHHLGGTVAIKVAKYFYNQGIVINLFAHCAPSSITNIIVGRSSYHENKDDAGKITYEKKRGHKVIAMIMKPFVKLMTVLSKMELNAKHDYKKLPKFHAEYIHVQSKDKEKRLPGEDGLITTYGSLHNVFKGERNKKLKQLKKSKDNLTKATVDGIYKTELPHEVVTQYKEAKADIKHEKTFDIPHANYDRVKAALSDLQPNVREENINNAMDYFVRFVEKSTQHESHEREDHERVCLK